MSESFWKKEIHLRKKPQPMPPLPSYLVERSRVRAERPAGHVVVPVVPENDPLKRVERWTSRVPSPRVEVPATVEFPRGPAAGEGQDPVALLPARATVDPAPLTPDPPTAAPSYGWTEPTSSADVPDKVAGPELSDIEPAATFGWSEPAPEEQTQIVATPAAVAVPDPVSDTLVSDTPAAPSDEKVPLLKREISFKRARKEPRAATPPVETPPDEEKVPLLKREISFKRARKEPKAATPPVETPPDEEKVPLLKREISFKRAPKQPKAATLPEPVSDTEVSDTPVASSDEKVPLLKREISFTRKQKEPKEQKEPKTAKEKPAKAEHGSPLKKELRLPKPRRAKAGAPGHKVERVIGLHIGSSQLAAAYVQNNGHAELVQIARAPLERGLVVAGEVRDAAALTREVKEFFSANKLPRKDVRLGIASNRIGVRILDVPAVDDPKQFENAIRFRAQELLPISVTDAIIDHVILGEREGDEGGVLRRVLLVFAHRELVSRYVETCRAAGVRLSGIDLDAFALLRAVDAPAAVADDQPRAVVAVAIGHERTILAVSDGTICDFTRVLEWGGSSLDVALARALDLTPSQAEPIKHQLSLDAEEAPEGLTPLQLEAAKSALRTEVGALGRELVSSLRFYQSRADSLAIGEVLLAGGAAQLGGLPAELQRLLGASVRLADPLARVTVGKKVKELEDVSSLAVAVGLGIEA